MGPTIELDELTEFYEEEDNKEESELEVLIEKNKKLTIEIELLKEYNSQLEEELDETYQELRNMRTGVSYGEDEVNEQAQQVENTGLAGTSAQGNAGTSGTESPMNLSLDEDILSRYFNIMMERDFELMKAKYVDVLRRANEFSKSKR